MTASYCSVDYDQSVLDEIFRTEPRWTTVGSRTCVTGDSNQVLFLASFCNSEILRIICEEHVLAISAIP